jgi:restriction system protein
MFGDCTEANNPGQADQAAAPPVAPPAESHSWKTELLKVVQAMPPDGFERLCRRILRESGFQRVVTTGKPGDGGIDGAGEVEINLISFRVVFQAKRWKSPVPSSVVRDFRGAMTGRAEKGLIITTSTFSAAARKEATRHGATPIDLFDGERLCGLLRRFELGLSVVQVERISVNRAFFEAI